MPTTDSQAQQRLIELSNTDSAVRARSAALWSDQWREALGPFWQWELALFAVLLFVTGLSLPFADPDLSIHLATGEWIARHHAVPFVEPFAWTRPGAPFQAYSWAIETLYFVVLSHWGPMGLSVLQGFVYVLLAAVMVILGKAARWNPWATFVMVAANLTVALGATPYVRPQVVLLIILPLIWALVYRSLDTQRIGWTLAGLFGASAVLANTHLLFPLAAAPCVLLLTQPPADRKRIALVPAAIVAGWFVSPYALHWVEVYRLNFAPNALFGPPTGINEYKPGYLMMLIGGNSSLALAILLTFLPWAAAPRLDSKARILYGLLWLAGLLMFALAVRSMVVWWLVVIPLCSIVLSQLQTPTTPIVLTAQRAIVPALFIVVALEAMEAWLDPSLRAGNVASRYLPSTNAKSIEPLARWLDCFTRHDVGGRLVTTFNYGGYVPWRLPYLSESIDGRVIFADSVSRPETYFVPTSRNIPLQPWRTADLAIFPVSLPVAAVLDTATGWHKAAITSQLEGPARMIGLWVTDRWWRRAGKIRLPRAPLPAMHSLDPRRATCAEVTPKL
jgi:hypothetical protein